MSDLVDDGPAWPVATHSEQAQRGGTAAHEINTSGITATGRLSDGPKSFASLITNQGTGAATPLSTMTPKFWAGS